MAKKTGGPAEAVVAGGVHGEPGSPKFLASVEIYRVGAIIMDSGVLSHNYHLNMS